MRHISAALALAFVALFAQPASAQADLFGDFGSPAWSRMWKYFELRFGNTATDEVVMTLPTATNAAWDDRNGIIRAMEMYKWGDWMPSDAWQYAPNANKRVSTGYGHFLNVAFEATVDANGTAPPALKNALKRANEEVEYTRVEYNEIQKQADDAYTAYVAATSVIRRKSKKDFFHEQGYDVEISTRKKRLDTALERFTVVTSSLVDPDLDLLTKAKLRYDNPNQQVLLPPVPEVLNDKDRWEKHYTSFIDKNIFTFLDESSPYSEHIEQSSTTSDYFERRWRASVSVRFLGLFRAGGASAEQVTRENHVRTNTTRIDISFDNIDTFNIVRGDWFDQTVIDRFGPKLPSNRYTEMWGPNGALEMIPKTLLVGRGLAFTIYADSQSLDYLYEHFQGSADAGIFIGFWRVGGGGGYSSTKEQTRVTRFNDHIVFEDLSGRAKVLGVLAKHYALSIPRPAFQTSLFTGVDEAGKRGAARRKIDALWTKPDLGTTLKSSVDRKSVIEMTVQ